MYFEFHPSRQPGRRSKTGKAHRFACVQRAAGVGQEEVFVRIDEIKNVGERIMLPAEVGAAQGNCHDLRTAGGKGIAHDFVGRKFPRADQETRGELASCNFQGATHSLF